MEYAGSERLLKSEYIVAPGADPSLILVQFDGAKHISIDAGGALVLTMPHGELREQAPVLYQDIEGRRNRIEGAFRLLSRDVVAFKVGSYDSRYELRIDPVLSYSTYLGGNGIDSATGIAVDSAGNSYVTGFTDSGDFPAFIALRSQSGGGVDAFVAKFSPSGTLLYATYLGGRGDDRAFGIAVDTAGNAFITGWTGSVNFPVTETARQATLRGPRDAFVTKLNPSGIVILYSSFLGGSGHDSGKGIATDAAGNIYVVGDTTSNDFPLRGAFQISNRGRQEAFVASLMPSGSLRYSTYLGGSGDDRGTAIAADGDGSVYVTGGTNSTNFPLNNPFQSANGGGEDAFVAKLAPMGVSLQYSTYLGGNNGTPGLPEVGNGIAVDSGGNAYVVGVTSSPNFPVFSALRTAHAGGGTDAFISKLNASGASLVYSTFLGGLGLDTAVAVVVDGAGAAYVAGNTAASNFPTVNAIQNSIGGLHDAFVAKLSPPGSNLLWSTYLGGSGSDGANAIALGPAGAIFFAGQTTSTNFPLLAAYQSFGLSEGNGFIASLTAGRDGATMSSPVPGSTLVGSTVTFAWTGAAGAEAYWLDVGTVFGQGNVFGANVGTVTSRSVSGIPTNGAPVYVRLWTNFEGVWQVNDYTYTAVVAADLRAVLTSPSPGSTLPGSTLTFSWTGGGVYPIWLDVGTIRGQGNIFGANLGAAVRQTVSGIPQDGRPIYVRLWTQINGDWQVNDYTFTAGDGKAVLLSPASSSGISSSTVAFSWSEVGGSAHWLDVGTVPGQGNIFGANVGTVTTKTVSGIPVDGRPIYIRLWTLIAGTWRVNDYTF